MSRFNNSMRLYVFIRFIVPNIIYSPSHAHYRVSPLNESERKYSIFFMMLLSLPNDIIYYMLRIGSFDPKQLLNFSSSCKEIKRIVYDYIARLQLNCYTDVDFSFRREPTFSKYIYQWVATNDDAVVSFMNNCIRNVVALENKTSVLNESEIRQAYNVMCETIHYVTKTLGPLVCIQLVIDSKSIGYCTRAAYFFAKYGFILLLESLMNHFHTWYITGWETSLTRFIIDCSYRNEFHDVVHVDEPHIVSLLLKQIPILTFKDVESTILLLTTLPHMSTILDLVMEKIIGDRVAKMQSRTKSKGFCLLSCLA